jgi:hypothetical protein
MPKSIAVLALAAFAVFALPATQVMADFIPPIGLPAGSPYQLIFVTADTTQATSSDISTYNAFVTAEAALNPSLPSATWNVVGSTATVNANVNAPSTPGIPIYNTQGQLVTDAGLYLTIETEPSTYFDNPPAYNQYGNLYTRFAYTGSLGNGTVNLLDGPLGGGTSFLPDTTVTIGQPNELNGAFLGIGLAFFDTESFPIYALSDPINTPEPTTITMLVSGFLTAGGFGLVRRRRRRKASESSPVA